MRNKAGLLVVALLVSGPGCYFTGGVGTWMPTFESVQESGGDPPADLETDLEVDVGTALAAFEIMGQEGGQRIRVDFWSIDTTGATTRTSTLNFGGSAFDGATDTTLAYESIGLMWEPGIQRGDFRFALGFGFDLVRLRMVVRDSDSASTIEFPNSGMGFDEIGLDHVPVPMLGLGAEWGLKEWLVLTVRAEFYDSAQMELVPEVTAQFLRFDAGAAFGKPTTRGIKGFVGYRHFHAEYTYEQDVGDTTLNGLLLTVGLRF